MDRAAPTPAPTGHSVQVISNTWARDSHDLFDFEAHHLQTKTFTVQRNAQFVRNGTDVQMLSSHAHPSWPAGDTPTGAEHLLKLVQKDGSFWVDKGVSSSSSKNLWLVVRDLPTASHTLSEGDVIKLGQSKFRVRQLVTSTYEDIQPELRLDDTGAFCSADPETIDQLRTTSCRICLLEGSTEEDPLIKPCLCKGSIEYVHLGCLRHWVKGRLNLSDAPGGSYFYRPLPCELCKSPYQAYCKMGNDVSSLVEVPKTTPPYIVLENMVRDSHQHSTRGLHVLSLAENKLLKLGRGHESDVRIADVSISRCHATIRLHQGSFTLEDNNSKFGTLVAMKKPRPLMPENPFSIQIGRTVLGLALQPNQDPAAMAALGAAAPQAVPRSMSLGADVNPAAGAAKDEQDPNAAAA
mmetsp:Transcript_83716/g.215564  ORF Transcript_83716/g.215564 Transcript_83716/m.215564 type:complete len:408 (+) Transcript_83716:94-1317(+)